jgi:hypothetical protein
MDEEALQREILRRLGVDNVPTHVSA